jgi:Fic family protein
MFTTDKNYISSRQLPQALVKTVRALGEYKGRQRLFTEQEPQILETLRRVALVQSTVSSSRIEGVTAPPARVKALLEEKAAPQDRPEQEIAGYRDMLARIHANHASMTLNTELVLELYRGLFRYVPNMYDGYKPVDNQIISFRENGDYDVVFVPTPAAETEEAMARLHEDLNILWASGDVEPLLLVASYVFDFLCIHPFLDGNGRVSRLLTLLLLYKAGYEVGRYISLERKVEDTKESYYEALSRTSKGWLEGKHDIIPWWEYFLGVMMLSCYKDFENKVGELEGSGGRKTRLVLEAIRQKEGEFTLRELMQDCPTVSMDLIRKVLQEERVNGLIISIGKGRGARWRKP